MQTQRSFWCCGHAEGSSFSPDREATLEQRINHILEPLHSASGSHHMAREERMWRALDARALAGNAHLLPILRLYRWDVPTVTLGHAQHPQRVLAPRWECWAAGQDPDGPKAVVRRPTGGRAVWHEDELTYAVILPLQWPGLAAQGPEAFLGQWLLEAARRAGVKDLTMDRGRSGRDPLSNGPAPCFASTSRWELRWKGGKWVGSARRMGRGALLQHGSIRLGPGGDKLGAWLGWHTETDNRPWSELPAVEVLAEALAEKFEERLVHG